MVDAEFELLEIRSQCLGFESESITLHAEHESCLIDREVRIGGGVGWQFAFVPLGAVAELVFGDEHLTVIETGVHKVAVGDVTDEAVFIEFVRIDGEIAKAGEFFQEDGEIGFAVALFVFADDEGEIGAVFVKPFLTDFVGVEGNIVRLEIHVAGRVEHDPFAMLVGPDFGGGMFG